MNFKSQTCSVRPGTFLMVQWLTLLSKQGPGFDPWSVNEIPHFTTKTLT